jgi:hypothetical protein
VKRVAGLWRSRLEANRADTGFTLTVSAPTNADAREIGAAIRAERQRAGDFETVVDLLVKLEPKLSRFNCECALREALRAQGCVVGSPARCGARA